MADSSRPPGQLQSHAGGVVQNLIAAAVGAGLPSGLAFAWTHLWQGEPPAWLKDNFLVNVAGAAIIVVLWTSIKVGAALFRIRSAAPRAKGDRVSVYVASLGEDEAGKSAWDHVTASLRRELGSAVEILPAGRAFQMKSGVNLDDAAAEATKNARKLLMSKNGDLLLWGKVHRIDKTVVELRFVSAGHDGAEGQRFGFTEKLLLEPAFGQEMSAALAALVAVQAAPAAKGGHYLVTTLRPLEARLSKLIQNMPATIREEQRAHLWFSHGLVQSAIGEQAGDSHFLRQAVDAYREVLKVCTRERMPRNWAMTQNNLGIALRMLGERGGGAESVRQAVDAYREALKEHTREQQPLDWATTQNNLGVALIKLGEGESSTEKLQQAVVACREALKERTRERVPLDWATTQNNLGIALRALGERESSTEKLEQAVVAYREALKERTRSRVPLMWATTQNNLGSVLNTWGSRERDTEKLEQAVDAYRDTLKEWTRERVPLDWAGAQSNLGNALAELGGRENGTRKLRQAMDAYHEALKEWTRERVPLDWAMVQNNLGSVLRVLGERESGTARLHEAVDACREALKERTRESVPLQWAKTQNNLGAALKTLGERENDAKHLEYAVEAYQAALKELENAPHYRELTQRNLDSAMQILEQLNNQQGAGN